MDRNTRSLGIAIVASALAFVLIGCSSQDDDCRTATPVVMFYSTADHHYHYGSATGKVVPGYKVPKAAANVPGYKVPKGTAKAPVNKVPPAGKPGAKAPGYKAPAPKPAPAPRSGRR